MKGFNFKIYNSITSKLQWKELSYCQNLKFSIPYIFATQCCWPLIFQPMNSVRLNNLSLKYQRVTLSGCKYIGIRTFEFVAKTHFLRLLIIWKSKCEIVHWPIKWYLNLLSKYMNDLLNSHKFAQAISCGNSSPRFLCTNSKQKKQVSQGHVERGWSCSTPPPSLPPHFIISHCVSLVYQHGEVCFRRFVYLDNVIFLSKT